MGKHRDDDGTRVISTGVKFGAVLAIVMSWTANHSILWMLLHGVLGWFYVIYFLIFRDGWTWL